MADFSDRPSLSRQQLMTSCQGLVRSIAWKIHQQLGRRVELDELIAFGQVGLAEAADRYDPNRANQFTTYAYHRIRGAIYDGLGKMGWFNAADFHAYRYERMARELLDSEPADGDQPEGHLAREVAWLTDVSARLAVVYLASELGSQLTPPEAGDPEDAHTPTPPAAAIRAEACTALKDLLERLPDLSRNLIRLLYFDGASLTDAAARLGVSKSWASRLHDTTLRRLAMGLRQIGAEMPAGE